MHFTHAQPLTCINCSYFSSHIHGLEDSRSETDMNMLAVLCCALFVASSVGAPKGYLETTKELSYRGQSRKRKDVPDAACNFPPDFL